jgi:uncharacterized protein YjbI with pentapeptide repeats
LQGVLDVLREPDLNSKQIARMASTFTIPMNLNGQHLLGNNMSNLNFIESSTFVKTCCSHCSFFGSKLVKCDLTDIDCSYSDIRNAIFISCIFKNANLLNTKVSGTTFKSSHLESFDPQTVFNCDLTNTNFSSCQLSLRPLNWALCKMNNVNLSYVSMIKPNFEFVFSKELLGCKFIESKMHYSVFKELVITQCDFSDSSLNHSDFSDSRLKNCDFMNVDLSFCNFSGVISEDCQFSNANLNILKISEKTVFINPSIDNITWNNLNILQSITRFPREISNSVFDQIMFSLIEESTNFFQVEFLNCKFFKCVFNNVKFCGYVLCYCCYCCCFATINIIEF